MTNEQREAIETMQHWIEYEKEHQNEINKAEELIHIQDTVLSLIKEQEKQIDLMAESIELQQYANIDTSNLDLVCEKLKCNKKCELVKKDCIKQYFERKVKK